MKSISVIFKKFDEVSLQEMLGQYCVYVIWDSQSKKKASYIGYTKNFGARIHSHKKWLAQPMNGYVAFFENAVEAKCLEAILIETGHDIDRLQAHNEVAGHARTIDVLNDKFGIIKFYIKGHNPFKNPKSSFYKYQTIHSIIVEDYQFSDTFRKRAA